MDVTWVLVSEQSRDAILTLCDGRKWQDLDRWMKQHYKATRKRSETGRNVYHFANKEKYMEFCLKWM